MDWKEAFPELAAFPEPEVSEGLAASSAVALQEGAYVFHTGSPCQAYLLVLSGDVRVQMVTEAGRSATLYHVRDGDSCVLTTACLLGQTAYPAEAIVERPTQALAMPKSGFDRAMAASPGFREFVFTNLGQRFAEVIARVEEIAFTSIDRRLARTLLLMLERDAVIVTHETLATEAGTVREVVSRHLKQFEARGWLHLRRGQIDVVDSDALARLAAGDG